LRDRPFFILCDADRADTLLCITLHFEAMHYHDSATPGYAFTILRLSVQCITCTVLCLTYHRYTLPTLRIAIPLSA